MRTQQYNKVFSLLLVFLFSMWVLNYFPQDELELTEVESERIVEHFAIGYSKKQMDQSGQANSKLMAETVVKYSDALGTELKNPVMVVYKQDKPPWIIRSKTGHISTGGNKISMNGQVFIDRAAAESVREVNIKTSNLLLLPNRDFAETDDWAEMVSGPDRISGVGMRLFYQEPLYIKLLAKVKGWHEYK